MLAAAHTSSMVRTSRRRRRRIAVEAINKSGRWSSCPAGLLRDWADKVKRCATRAAAGGVGWWCGSVLVEVEIASSMTFEYSRCSLFSRGGEDAEAVPVDGVADTLKGEQGALFP